MDNLFSAPDRKAILERLDRLPSAARRIWGKMDAAQMLAHCSAALEVATGDSPKKQMFVGRLLAPFFKGKILGEAPFSKDSPTDPGFIVTGPRDFATEKARLTALVHRFCDSGSSAADGRINSFLGRLTGDEWGRMMWKHLDHHLRQFGA
jgi:hypothetical protein